VKFAGNPGKKGEREWEKRKIGWKGGKPSGEAKKEKEKRIIGAWCEESEVRKF